jgi:hypothetical protein
MKRTTWAIEATVNGRQIIKHYVSKDTADKAAKTLRDWGVRVDMWYTGDAPYAEKQMCVIEETARSNTGN